jgi:outer membrane protein TolC
MTAVDRPPVAALIRQLTLPCLIVGALLGAELQAQSSPAGGGEVLTLEMALELALQANRDIRNAGLEVQKAGDQLAAARTRRLPSMDLAGVSGHFRPLFPSRGVSLS